MLQIKGEWHLKQIFKMSHTCLKNGISNLKQIVWET